MPSLDLPNIDFSYVPFDKFNRPFNFENNISTSASQPLHVSLSDKVLAKHHVAAPTVTSVTTFTCSSFPVAYDPYTFCSGVVDYAFVIPTGSSLLTLETEARALSDNAMAIFTTACLSDMKKLFCAMVYKPCIENVVSGDTSTFDLIAPSVLIPYQRPCRSLCVATTSAGNTCGGVLEALGMAMDCDVLDPATGVAMFDSSNNALTCNALTSTKGVSVVAAKYETYIGTTCKGIIDQAYLPPPSALAFITANLAPLPPSYVVQTVLEQFVAAVTAVVPRMFTQPCLEAQRKYLCSKAFFHPHQVPELKDNFPEFYLPSYPHRNICTQYIDTCASAIVLAPVLAANCTASANNVMDFPTKPQTILVLSFGGQVLDLKTPPYHVETNASITIPSECPYAFTSSTSTGLNGQFYIAGTSCSMTCPGPGMFTQAELDLVYSFYKGVVIVSFFLSAHSLMNIYILPAKKRNLYVAGIVWILSAWIACAFIQILVSPTFEELLCSSNVSWHSIKDYNEDAQAFFCFASGVTATIFTGYTPWISFACVVELWLRVVYAVKNVKFYRYFYLYGTFVISTIFIIVLFSSEGEVQIMGSSSPLCFWTTKDPDMDFIFKTMQFAVAFAIASVTFAYIIYIGIKISLQITAKGESVLAKLWKTYRVMFLLESIMLIEGIFFSWTNIDSYYVNAENNVNLYAWLGCQLSNFLTKDNVAYLDKCGLHPETYITADRINLIVGVLSLNFLFFWILTFTSEVQKIWLSYLPDVLRKPLTELRGFGKSTSVSGRESVVSSSSGVNGNNDEEDDCDRSSSTVLSKASLSSGDMMKSKGSMLPRLSGDARIAPELASLSMKDIYKEKDILLQEKSEVSAERKDANAEAEDMVMREISSQTHAGSGDLNV